MTNVEQLLRAGILLTRVPGPCTSASRTPAPTCSPQSSLSSTSCRIGRWKRRTTRGNLCASTLCLTRHRLASPLHHRRPSSTHASPVPPTVLLPAISHSALHALCLCFAPHRPSHHLHHPNQRKLCAGPRRDEGGRPDASPLPQGNPNASPHPSRLPRPSTQSLPPSAPRPYLWLLLHAAGSRGLAELPRLACAQPCAAREAERERFTSQR
jgi:hypothetical protein